MNTLTTAPQAWAARVWRQHQPNPMDRTLTDWTTSTAADGRPLHTARVDHPDAVQLLHRAAERFDRSRLSAITQEHPHLDIHTPGRVALMWLLNGEWIELWAPEPAETPAHEGDRRMSDNADVLIAVKAAAVHAWYLLTTERGSKVRVPDWRVGRTADGSPSLSCEVVGPDAAEMLHRFADQSPLILNAPGDLRPTYEYSTPGRTGCVWRSCGVWVELWHPDTAPATEQPTPVPPPARRLLRRPIADLDPRAVPGRRVLFTGYPSTPRKCPGVITGITADGTLRVRLDGQRSNIHITPETLPPSKQLVLLDEVGPVPELPMGRFHPTVDDVFGEYEGVLVNEFEYGDIVLLTADPAAVRAATAAYCADTAMAPDFFDVRDIQARWVVFEWQPEDAEYPWVMEFVDEGTDMALPVHYLPA